MREGIRWAQLFLQKRHQKSNDLLDRTSSGGGRDHSSRSNSCSPNFFLFRKSMVSTTHWVVMINIKVVTLAWKVTNKLASWMSLEIAKRGEAKSGKGRKSVKMFQIFIFDSNHRFSLLASLRSAIIKFDWTTSFPLSPQGWINIVVVRNSLATRNYGLILVVM